MRLKDIQPEKVKTRKCPKCGALMYETGTVWSCSHCNYYEVKGGERMSIAKKAYREIKSRMKTEGMDPSDFYYSGGYDLAIEIAKKHGGTYIYNSNANGGYYSFAPTYIYKFPDGSLLRVTYSGCWVEEEKIERR